MENKKLLLGILVFVLVGGLVIGTTQIPMREKYFEIVKGTEVQQSDLQKIVQNEFPNSTIISSELERNNVRGKNIWSVKIKYENNISGTIKIDADNGELISFSKSYLLPNINSNLSKEDIEKMNSQYFPTSSEYVLIKERENNDEYSYFYGREVDDVKIEPDSISIKISKNGEIVSYSKYHHETLPDLEPKITAQEAEEKAYKKLNSNKKQLTGQKDSRLIVDTNLVGKLKLFWEVKLYSNKPYSGYYYLVYVDAKDGSISFMDALL